MDTTMQSGRETIRETAKDIKQAGRQAVNTAADKARSLTSGIDTADLRDSAEEYYDVAQEYVTDAVKTSVTYAKAHPVQTLLGAVAIGFVAGIFASRHR